MAAIAEAQRAARGLRLHAENMTAERRARLTATLESHFGGPYGEADVAALLLVNTRWRPQRDETHHARVVALLSATPGALANFCMRWRQHFLDTMRPRHLSEFWDVQHHREGEAEEYLRVVPSSVHRLPTQ